MAITQRVKLDKWHNVYNRRKRLVGEWAVYRNKAGKFTYRAYVWDKNFNAAWDLTGYNPEYDTAIEASKAAIENILHP